MMLGLIAGVALLILGVLAYLVSQWPEKSAAARRKERRELVAAATAAAQPPKDLEGTIERLEQRILTLDNTLQASQRELKDKLREIDEFKAATGGLERQLEQEKAWRDKEEASVLKQKKYEQELQAEIARTRHDLHLESNQRIRLEYEVKELRLVKDSLSADLRKFIGQNNELDRRVNAFIMETRQLKAENLELKQKKEADQWVAKDDHVKLEKLLKAARHEIEQLKKRLPVELREVRPMDE